MKNQTIVFLLPWLVPFAAAATTWTIYPTDQDGMTPSQQLTNAVMRATDGNRLIAPNALLVAGARAVALGVHKYALRPESPAIGMGDASMFTAADLDYAGNLRLREGRLDPGCFECWLNITGTRFIFR